MERRRSWRKGNRSPFEKEERVGAEGGFGAIRGGGGTRGRGRAGGEGATPGEGRTSKTESKEWQE